MGIVVVDTGDHDHGRYVVGLTSPDLVVLEEREEQEAQTQHDPPNQTEEIAFQIVLPGVNFGDAGRLSPMHPTTSFERLLALQEASEVLDGSPMSRHHDQLGSTPTRTQEHLVVSCVLGCPQCLSCSIAPSCAKLRCAAHMWASGCPPPDEIRSCAECTTLREAGVEAGGAIRLPFSASPQTAQRWSRGRPLGSAHPQSVGGVAALELTDGGLARVRADVARLGQTVAQRLLSRRGRRRRA